jgi:inhibitor of cysteine peptidase
MWYTSAFSARAGDTEMQAISESFDGKTVDLAVGQVIELRLKENPTTGFRWQLRHDGTPACRITEDFIEPATTERAPVPGRGGTHVWRIEGVQAGTCDMALTYARNWEASRPPAMTFEVHVHVTR